MPRLSKGKPPHFLAGLRQGGGSPPLFVSGRTEPVVDRLEGAFDSESRRRGLLGRDRIDRRDGMAIAPTNAVHTFFMRFPIDLVFVARDGVIVKIRADVRPWRIAGARAAFAVIELAAGAAAAAGLRVGDRLIVGSDRGQTPNPRGLTPV